MTAADAKRKPKSRTAALLPLMGNARKTIRLPKAAAAAGIQTGRLRAGISKKRMLPQLPAAAARISRSRNGFLFSKAAVRQRRK